MKKDIPDHRQPRGLRVRNALRGRLHPAAVIRYYYALGWMFGFAFGVTLIGAFWRGGEWWAFPPFMLAGGVAGAFWRIRRRGEDAELR